MIRAKSSCVLGVSFFPGASSVTGEIYVSKLAFEGGNVLRVNTYGALGKTIDIDSLNSLGLAIRFAPLVIECSLILLLDHWNQERIASLATCLPAVSEGHLSCHNIFNFGLTGSGHMEEASRACRRCSFDIILKKRRRIEATNRKPT